MGRPNAVATRYLANPFEVAARRAADRVRATMTGS